MNIKRSCKDISDEMIRWKIKLARTVTIFQILVDSDTKKGTLGKSILHSVAMSGTLSKILFADDAKP